jgi:hypothetical protein
MGDPPADSGVLTGDLLFAESPANARLPGRLVCNSGEVLGGGPRRSRWGPVLRAVAATPSAPTALQRARDFGRVHCQRVERACACVGEKLDLALAAIWASR